MLNELFPRAHVRYASPPLLGTIADGFAAWLVRQGYTRRSLRLQLRALQRVDRYLRCRRRLRYLCEVTGAELCACAAARGARDPQLASTAHAVERYLTVEHALPPAAPAPPTRTATQLEAYATYLHDVRGLQPVTRRQHLRTAAELLAHLTYEDTPARFAALTASDLEAFVGGCGRRLSRATLQHTVAQLRAFLRFLSVHGVLRPGLETQLDTPRCYRGEQLPRALPWRTVRAFLRAIDRRTPLGLRDYTMFFLIATYGLRASEIVTLTLDDVDWRGSRLRVPAGKTGTPRLLPLADAAGTVLLRYLRRGRPSLPYRELFLRGRAPVGVLKPTTVTEAFQKWARRSGLDIPWPRERATGVEPATSSLGSYCRVAGPVRRGQQRWTARCSARLRDVAMVATWTMVASVRDLKNRTSELLRRVRAGEHLLVTDRGRPIAEITPVRPERLSPEARLVRLAERGEITLPKGRGLADIVPLRRRGRAVAETLLEDRG